MLQIVEESKFVSDSVVTDESLWNVSFGDCRSHLSCLMDVWTLRLFISF